MALPNSPRLLDLRIKEREPKKLMVRKRKEEVVEEKEKRKILITKKKLIKLVNSPAARAVKMGRACRAGP